MDILILVLLFIAVLAGSTGGAVLGAWLNARRLRAEAAAVLSTVEVAAKPRSVELGRVTPSLVCPFSNSTCCGPDCALWSATGRECLVLQVAVKALTGEPGNATGIERRKRGV